MLRAAKQGPSTAAKHAEIAARYRAAKRAATEANKERNKAPFAALRLSELERFARFSFGSNVPDTASGRALTMTMLEYVVRINGPEIGLQWIGSRVPWAVPEAQAMVERSKGAKIQTADELAWRIGLTLQDRSRLRIRTIGAVGTTTQSRKEMRKTANTKAKAEARRAAGVIPREQYEAQSKSRNEPWKALGMSRASWYRQGRPQPPDANWQRAHSEALRAMPELRGRFADAATAAQSIEDFGALRREVLDQYQRGAIGKLLGAQSSDEITRIVGGIFGQKDAAQQMQRLVAETKHDAAARDGLRKSVIDFISSKFISNAEAATIGENLIRSDQFQNFIRQNAPALRSVLTEEQVNSLRAIAADLHRANRSITAVKLPGGSNTAQDQAAAKISLLSKLVRRGAEAAAIATTGAVGGGPWGALAGLLGHVVVGAMREAGMKNVDDLVKTAMLNPEVARKLLAKASMNNRTNAISLAAAIRRAASGPALNLVFGNSQENH